LNLRMFVTRHWKTIMIALAIGLFALSLVAANAHAEPIDSPVGPRAI
jgi:hypothetical protein